MQMIEQRKSVGRPTITYTCNRCGTVLGSAAVRSHKCSAVVQGVTKSA